MKHIRFISLALIVAILAAIPSYALDEPSFSDIRDHWAEAYIERQKDSGVLSGYPDGTFRPDEPITRAELAKILVAAFDLDDVVNAPNDIYTDVSADEWYVSYVRYGGVYIPSYATAHSPYTDVYRNKADGAFLPDEPVMRYHAAEAFATLMQKHTGETIELPSVTEINADLKEYYPNDGNATELIALPRGGLEPTLPQMQAQIWLAHELGLMVGNGDGTFDPYSTLTRAEVVTIIDRIVNDK